MPPPVQDISAGLTGRRTRLSSRTSASDDARRTFLRMVSHELRTPLNSVIGFSEILSRELYGPMGDERYREHARMVHESGVRLLRLVNDVLDIARLEAGAMDLDLRPEPPLIAIEEAVRTVAPEARRRNVTILFEAAARAPDVMADQRALQRIFVNLIQNAVAHSPAGGRVTIRSSEEAGRSSFEITDYGAGVAEEDLPAILRPFEQGESALVRKTEGAGLGLSIVGLLCEAMNGEFLVRSTPGEGLTAVVQLPSAAEEVGLLAAGGLGGRA